MDRPRAVVEGEDDEDSACSDDGQQEEQQHDTHGGGGGEPGEQGEGVEAGHSHDGGSRGQEGSAHPARLHVTLTQNQLKLSARLDSTHRKLRSTLRTRNEKALAQLRGAGACLQRATQAVQGAKRTVDAALEDLATKLQVAGAPTPGSPVAQNP